MSVLSGILIGMAALAVLALLSGILLGFASVRFKVEKDPVVEQIDSILPQTQCGQCGYPGCRPYAEAIAKAMTPVVNKCLTGNLMP